MNYNTVKLSKNNNNKGSKTDFTQFFKLLNARKLFFMLILITLLIQIAITYYIHINFDNFEITKDTNQRRWIIIYAHIMSFVFFIILGLFSMPLWLKFILLSLFSVTMGIVLEDVKLIIDEHTIKTAFIGVISIFVSIFAFGLAIIKSNVVLTYKFSLGLYFVLLILLISTIVHYFMYTSSILKKTGLGFTLLLFSVYIVYATNIILQRDYSGDFITASMDYYLEIFNMFVALLYDTIMKLFYIVKNSVK